MKRRLALVLLFVLAANCAVFSTPQRREERRADREAKRAAEAHSPPLLWEVRGDAGVLYLFGTMHFGVSQKDLSPIVTETLAACDTFVLESDPTTADQRRLADMMILPHGTPGLDERLGPERWRKLLVLLDGMFDERVAVRLRPWVIEAAAIREILPTEESMEVELVAEAQQRGLPIEYLESWETQIAMLNEVTSVEALSEIVDDPDGFRDRTQRMSVDYIKGDLDALQKHVFGANYATQDALFEDRNRAWMPRLDELARSRRAFVAVGAGHLIGPDSVLEMLKARGYKLRRLQ